MRSTPFIVAASILVCGFLGASAAMLAGSSIAIVICSGLIAAAFIALGLEARERAAQNARVEEAIVRLARGIERTGARVNALEDRLRGAEEWIAIDARDGVAQSAAEIEMLGTLVKELAVTVAHHDAELGGTLTRDNEPAPVPQQKIDSSTEDREVARVLQAIDRSIAEEGIELLMQPIVSLPQRRVKFYEATPHLRDGADGVIGLPQILPVADASGRRVAFDLAVLRRVFSITRRLLARSRDLVVFCRIDLATARDDEALVSLLQGNQDMGGHLVLTLGQSSARALGAAGFARLSRLVDLGFSFAVNDISDLRLDSRNLFDTGVRFVKIPAAMLLSDGVRAPSEIHPNDLARMMSRNGVQLIVENVDLEKTVPEVLDLDIRFGQGNAFSPPRPIRPDVLQGRQAPVTPEAPAANDEAAAAMAAETAQRPRVPYRSVLKRAH